jgi:hypothetical protein
MPDCIKEQQTQHYLGHSHGCGPVRDDEEILFAVFDETEREGRSLIGNSFEETHLKRDALSLARSPYVTREEFDLKVVAAGAAKKGAFVGIAWAEVAILRSLRADIQLNAGRKKVRALCILDRVEINDFDGHATAGYCEEIAKSVGQKQLGVIRAKIRLDLANTFSPISDADIREWPSERGVAVAIARLRGDDPGMAHQNESG